MLILHKPHSCAHDAHCCCAYFPTIGPDPDTACQCTSLHEPQAARVEEETDGYQLFGGEPWVHSYCITTHTHTHTHTHTRAQSQSSCLTAMLVPVFIGRAFTGNISLVISYSCSKPAWSTNFQMLLKWKLKKKATFEQKTESSLPAFYVFIILNLNWKCGCVFF